VPKEFIPAVKKGVDEAINERRPRRLPVVASGDADRRLVPRGRLQRERVQDGGDFAFKDGMRAGSPTCSSRSWR